MNISVQNFLPKLWRIKRLVAETWRAFLYAPIRYWKATLLFFAVLLVALLLIDAIIFWQLVLTFDQGYTGSDEAELKLERESLEAALMLLERRHQRFDEAKNGVSVENVFGSPNVSP
ncbi:MAG: hypothetical protein G01um101429_537 [Parcubacteria group bacterium Gr01-1014_29]|nr:MAG: hypothetical protein G01um101429_537 [Parcubacteria group bacterium Gr01-1014_29]